VLLKELSVGVRGGSFDAYFLRGRLLQDSECHAGHGQLRELLLKSTNLAFGRGGLAAEGVGFMFVGFECLHDG
jgi:hypothetical protein